MAGTLKTWPPGVNRPAEPLDWCGGVIILATVRIFASDRSNPGKREEGI
jgi:hypothetical protein